MCIRDSKITSLHPAGLGNHILIQDTDKIFICIISVSYTHLDVYKRQTVNTAFASLIKSSAFAVIPAMSFELPPSTRMVVGRCV